MAKTKKSSNKSKLKSVDFEHYLLAFLLAALLICSAVLVARNQTTNIKTELADPPAPMEQKE